MTAIAALVAWVISAGVGVVMLLRWRRAVPPPPAALIHLAAAATGLALWITYLSTDRPAALAWVTFGVLIVINGLGDMLLTVRWRARRANTGHGSAILDYFRAAREVMSGKRPAALAHAFLAPAILVLVLVTAL
ncbi:hypothetical protein [Actinocrispum sp. NPDC049592]|uniref:hypothetical protein n=1 Tax=Actinocrispum sp. NPDC049592 TaxID=3154835 RepID=UPI003447BD52